MCEDAASSDFPVQFHPTGMRTFLSLEPGKYCYTLPLTRNIDYMDTGNQFQCSLCRVWSHVNCNQNIAKQGDLSGSLRCSKCAKNLIKMKKTLRVKSSSLVIGKEVYAISECKFFLII